MCQIWCFYHKSHNSVIFLHQSAGLIRVSQAVAHFFSLLHDIFRPKHAFNPSNFQTCPYKFSPFQENMTYCPAPENIHFPPVEAVFLDLHPHPPPPPPLPPHTHTQEILLWPSPIAGFHCHAIKIKIENHSMNEVKKFTRYRRYINKYSVQASGLCGIPYSSYLT